MSGRALDDLLALPIVEASQAIIGWTVAHDGCSGVIVETEAYHDTEPACHAFGGPTPRNEVLFEAPGLAYIYRSYGIHALLNVVVEPEGVGSAILIRALEPLTGVDRMRERRRLDAPTALCSGPGKLTQALGIGIDLHGSDLRSGPIRLGPPPAGWEQPGLVTGLRVGITKAPELPWRFCAAGNPHVSRPWPPGFRETVAARRRAAA